MTDIDTALKSRGITLLTKGRIVKAMVFPAVMYGCESWTIKKAGRWRTDAFKFWCWRRLLTLPWTARRLNQSILKEINPEYSLEGLMLKLKFQYLMWRADSLESPWWRRRGKEWDGWMVSLTQWTWVWASSELSMYREAWCAAVHGVAKSRTWLSDRTELSKSVLPTETNS